MQQILCTWRPLFRVQFEYRYACLTKSNLVRNDLLNPRRLHIGRQELKNCVQSNNGDSLKVKSVSQRSSVSKFLFVRIINEDKDDQIHLGGNRMESLLSQ